MPVSELLLDGPVKSFQVAIGLGMSWVVKEVHQVVFLARLVKMLEEFAAIISLDIADSEWRHAGKYLEEIPPVS